MSQRAKVVLYNPQSDFGTMPLALLAVGSHLDPERYEVIIHDGRTRADALDALLADLDGALCLGVTVLTGTPLRDALAATRAARAAFPRLPIVWGGWHPSLFGRECLAEPSVDITVQAQGESTLLALVERLAEGGSPAGCAGLTWRGADGEAVREPPRALVDVNQLRPHNYDLVDVEAYFRLKGKRQLDYISSQGCHFRCAFCADPTVYQRRWTGLEADRVVAEIEHWWRRHGFDDVNFQDETLFTYPRRVAAMAEGFLQRGLKVTWAGTMRADQGTRMTDEEYAVCKRSGLRRVLMGVESGAPDMLARIKKDVTLDQVFEAAERCRQHGIAVQFPFIVGFPGETPQQVDQTLAVAARLATASPLFSVRVFYFQPYPGTALTAAAVADGYRLPDSLEAWADFHFADSVGPWVTPEVYERVEAFKAEYDIALV